MGWEKVAATDYRPAPLEVRVASRLARCLNWTSAALRLACEATEGRIQEGAADGRQTLQLLISEALAGGDPPTEYETRAQAWARDAEVCRSSGVALDEENRDLLLA